MSCFLFCLAFSSLGRVIIGGELIGSSTHGGSAYDIPGDGKVAAGRAALLRCSQLRGVWMRVSLHQGVGACLQGVGGEGWARAGGGTHQSSKGSLWSFGIFFSQAVLQEMISIVEDLGDFAQRSYINVEVI